MKTIAISNFKGGVGKTTLAANLGVDISTRLKKKVLLVDFDPQCNLSEYFFEDIDEKATYMDIYTKNAQELSRSIINPNLDILIGGLELEMFSNIVTNDSRYKLNPGAQLRKILKLVQNEYDFCIIDTRPAIDLTVSNALIAADYVLIPVQPTARSLKGLNETMRLIDEICEENNPQLQLLGLVLNEYVSKNVSAEYLQKQLADLQDKIFSTRIRKAEAVIYSENTSTDVFVQKRNEQIKDDFRNLTDELINKINN